MSRRLSNAAGGVFASAPRKTVADAYEFIRAQKARGAPVTAIARMLGKNPADVALIYHAAPLAAVPREETPPAPPPPPPPPPPGRRCAKSACVRDIPERALKVIRPLLEIHGVTMAELAGPSGKGRLSQVRQAAYAALHEAGFSLQVIGSYFGGRDHAAIHYGIRTHRRRAAEAAQAEGPGATAEAA